MFNSISPCERISERCHHGLHLLDSKQRTTHLALNDYHVRNEAIEIAHIVHLTHPGLVARTLRGKKLRPTKTLLSERTKMLQVASRANKMKI